MAVEKLGVATLASVVGFAGLGAIGQPARACGGCFGPPGASAPVVAHRMARLTGSGRDEPPRAMQPCLRRALPILNRPDPG